MTATVESDGSTVLDFEDFKEQYQKVPVEEYPNRVVETMPEPMISVKVSTYQHVDFIEDCLDGILMQETDFPFEILIGEDESDDGTREICKEYADRHPDKIRLFLHRRENNIKIHGRPTGKFQSTYTRFRCRGKYIAMCEGDDYWTDPKKLQKQVDFLEVNEEYVLAYHPWVEKKTSSNLEPEKGVRDRKIKKWPHTPTLLFENVIDCENKESTKIINGDAYLKYRLLREGKFGIVNDVSPSVYRRHDDSMYGSKSSIQKSYESCCSRLIMLNCLDNNKVRSKIIKDIAFFLNIMLNNLASSKEMVENMDKIGYIAMEAIKKGVWLELIIDRRVWQFARIRAGRFRRDVMDLFGLYR